MEKQYNPEGSRLRRDQLELLNMLKIVAKICKENNIPWWLEGGTLLGAARHKGFIPWDDDIDIALLKKDCNRLEKILSNYESDEYVYHCMKTDTDYINVFGKFRRKRGQIQSKSHRYAFYKWKGIGLDIFSIEKTSYFAAKLSSRIYSKLQSFTLNIDNDYIRKGLIILIELITFIFINPLLRLIGKINPKKEYHFTLGTGWSDKALYFENIFPLSEISFEGEMMPAPKNIDAYLTNEYGNWREMPSKEEIKKSIHCQEYREEIFGKDE